MGFNEPDHEPGVDLEEEYLKWLEKLYGSDEEDEDEDYEEEEVIEDD